MTYHLFDPLLCECAASGQLDASQVHAHRQAGELPAATHRPAHGGFPDGGMPDPYSGPAEPIRPTLALVGDFTVVQNAAHRELQRQAGEAQTLRLAMSEIVETLDAGGDHPRLVLIGRAALSLRGVL